MNYLEKQDIYVFNIISHSNKKDTEKVDRLKYETDTSMQSLTHTFNLIYIQNVRSMVEMLTMMKSLFAHMPVFYGGDYSMKC